MTRSSKREDDDRNGGCYIIRMEKETYERIHYKNKVDRFKNKPNSQLEIKQHQQILLLQHTLAAAGMRVGVRARGASLTSYAPGPGISRGIPRVGDPVRGVRDPKN